MLNRLSLTGNKIIQYLFNTKLIDLVFRKILCLNNNNKQQQQQQQQQVYSAVKISFYTN